MTAKPHEFSPDWTIAPAALLYDWLDERRTSLPTLASACVGSRSLTAALVLVQDVLDRKPLTEAHAELLERGTGISAAFWLTFEKGYRADLAAGRTDTTPEYIP